MLYVELRRKRDGKMETHRLGPFKEITYGGFDYATLLCDGKTPFSHVPQFLGLVLKTPFQAGADPDVWTWAIITAE